VPILDKINQINIISNSTGGSKRGRRIPWAFEITCGFEEHVLIKAVVLELLLDSLEVGKTSLVLRFRADPGITETCDTWSRESRVRSGGERGEGN
jgi:hypothetical protein